VDVPPRARPRAGRRARAADHRQGRGRGRRARDAAPLPGAKSQQIALSGAAWFEAKLEQPGHKNIDWSTHSFDSVRFESILCLLYGADKVAHAELMKQYKVPPKKLVKCERDAPLRFKAWEKMLEPYALKKGAPAPRSTSGARVR
jgi:hypothetical protein